MKYFLIVSVLVVLMLVLLSNSKFISNYETYSMEINQALPRNTVYARTIYFPTSSDNTISKGCLEKGCLEIVGAITTRSENDIVKIFHNDKLIATVKGTQFEIHLNVCDVHNGDELKFFAPANNSNKTEIALMIFAKFMFY